MSGPDRPSWRGLVGDVGAFLPIIILLVSGVAGFSTISMTLNTVVGAAAEIRADVAAQRERIAELDKRLAELAIQLKTMEAEIDRLRGNPR